MKRLSEIVGTALAIIEGVIVGMGGGSRDDEARN
jgi:hypothetical protein